MYPAGLRVDQLWQARSLGTISNNLPGAVAADGEDEQSPVFLFRSATFNVVSQQRQSLLIQRDSADSPMFLFLGHRFPDFKTAPGTERVLFPQPGTALWTGKSETLLQALNCHSASIKVDVFDYKAESLSDSAS